MGKQQLISVPEGTKVPDHIAIIPDGNRRWARAKGKDTLEGHKRGFEITTELARAARALGVHTLSLWGFSTENWDRSDREIKYLMLLYETLVEKHLKEALREGVRIYHLGRRDRLPQSLIRKIEEAEEKTKNNTKYILNICLDYGGRDELVRAANKIYDLRFRNNDKSPITAEDIELNLDTAGQPYPYVDLLIRTSGEQRTSGMLLWQAAYAESYWDNDHFPDFDQEKLKNAVLDYSRRRRRFGGNDNEEHLKFNPKVVAGLELKWRRAFSDQDSESLSHEVIKYMGEQYGLSKELAKSAGGHMLSALRYRKTEDWVAAKEALIGLYEIVKKSVGLAMEPEVVANFEVKLWNRGGEEDMKNYLAEKFRFSEFQARKSAHLAYLAHEEMDKQEWIKARGHLEKFYQALKERVA